MHGNGRHICTRRHSGDRQAAAEIKVRAVCFVREAQHTGIVRHLYDCAQVAANAVVCGVIDEHRHGVRVFADGFCHLLALHTERNTEAMIHLRVDVDRHRAAEHQSIQNAAVDVAGQNNLIAALTCGENHALYGACGAAHH